MALTQCLRRNAQQLGGQTATIDGDRRQTWSEMQDRVARLAAGIRALDVKTGDRIAILAGNSDRYLEFCFATWWAGAILVPMNIRWSAQENAYSLRDSGAEILFVDDNFTHLVPDILAQETPIRQTVHMGDGDAPAGMLRYEGLVADNDPAPDAETGSNDLAGIFYTGGTTGFPKGVMQTQRAIWSSGISMALLLRLGTHTCYLHAAPMFHMADFCGSIASIVAGATHVFINAFDPKELIRVINETGVTYTILVPTMIKAMVETLEADPTLKVDSLRQVLFGAAPMPAALLERTVKVLPDVEWCQGYGQTELAPLITVQGPEYVTLTGPNAAKLHSAGQAGPCVEIYIADDDGNEVPRGEVGEIFARGPNAMEGYWNKPEETEAAMHGTWVRTGDAAWMDDDGFIYIADRLKDMIISGGENIFSAEVESAVSKHPAVADNAVIGIPSEQWGETVHAIVILREGSSATSQDIIDHCRELIAHYKCPRSVEFRTEPLPLSGAGKVLKRDLRAPFWEDQDRQVS